MEQQEIWHRHQQATRAAHYRANDATFAAWACGYGVIQHEPDTQVRVFELVGELEQRGLIANRQAAFDILTAADRIASSAMWLVVHMTYARHVRLEGGELSPTDFKPDPQGHTGGSLNMVPAYMGYLTLNSLTRFTRGWVMGQGHCVAAIDACNLLVGNTSPEHAARYDLSNSGLTRFVQDFYAYAVNAEGRPVSPLGSHVNVHTAGGISEGGYLGFTELQYVHMPLPGERLVAFLSDGAWEEQRGSDWAARWWRAEDSGFVMPVMIANGRRIEQRTSAAQHGGAAWLSQHLRLNGFHPITIDGHDPAAFVCALWEAEERQAAFLEARKTGQGDYPFPLRYIIAECVKGFGFPGAGTNSAHNLPLSGNPSKDAAALTEFNQGATKLHVAAAELNAAIPHFRHHAQQQRPPERDHALTRRTVPGLQPVKPDWLPTGTTASSMAAIDGLFFRTAEANPGHRVRLGNPDELASNRMGQTLAHLKHRSLSPEVGVAEDLQGSIITALNEEAVASAALGNKGGLNLVVSYEAFAVKMLGAMRQEILFARHQKEAGRPPQWLSVPFLLTSHTWENGKNEQSHQDPTLSEALLGEMADTAVVRFPADANSAMACLADCLQRRGELHALVVAKAELPVLLTAGQAAALVEEGALLLAGESSAPVQLIAVGAYQLIECQKAWQRLADRGVSAALIVILEPARFRQPRDENEKRMLVPAEASQRVFGNGSPIRVFVTHTRPEPMLGVLRPLDTGRTTRALGYLNRGGTLTESGMLYANRSSWLHVLTTVAALQGEPGDRYLEEEEIAVLEGDGNPLPIIQAGPHSLRSKTRNE